MERRLRYQRLPSWGLGWPSLVVLLGGWIVSRELSRSASFDEGVYLNSLRALQRGASLGSQVFASQPPAFYLLMRLDALVLPGTLTGLRAGFMLLELAGCLGAFALARLYAGPLGGVIAAVLFAAAPPVVGLAPAVSPDMAAISIGLVGIAVLGHVWERRIARRAFELPAALIGGALIATAAAIKLDGVLSFVAAASLALAVRPGRHLVAAAVAGALLALACILAPFIGVVPQLWRSVVSLHLAARRAPHIPGGSDGFISNLIHIGSAFEARSNLVVWLMLLGCAALLVQSLRHVLDRRVLWLLAWPAAGVLFMAWQRPLFAHNVVLLAGAAAVPAAVGLTGLARTVDRRRLQLTVVALGALVLAAYSQATLRAVPAESALVLRAVALVRADSQPASYVVATDQPIVPFLAHRKVPPPLVDTSWVRLRTGSLSSSKVVALAQADRVTLVLAGHRLLDSAPTRRALDSVFGHQRRLGSNETIFLRRSRSSTG